MEITKYQYRHLILDERFFEKRSNSVFSKSKILKLPRTYFKLPKILLQQTEEEGLYSETKK